MNETPTTNARWETLCCSGQSWYQIAEEMKLDCRQLERELTAVTAQRDGLRSGIDYASDQLHKVTEQRDRLAEVLRLITNGTSCRECGGEDQALLARESLQSLTPNEL
jgi:SMC interacting uncharacterized protein involved in chromosome segregation